MGRCGPAPPTDVWSPVARTDPHLQRLAQVPAFRALTPKQVALLASQADTVGVPAGHLLVRQGDPGAECFVLLSGEVSVAVDGVEVAVLSEGAVFGELALIDPAPRSASVTTLSPTEVLVIGAQRFAPLLEEVPQLARQIMVGLARRLREVDREGGWQEGV